MFQSGAESVIEQACLEKSARERRNLNGDNIDDSTESLKSLFPEPQPMGLISQSPVLQCTPVHLVNKWSM